MTYNIIIMIIKRNIVAGIKDLQTYLALLKEKPQIFKPESCLHCGLKVLWNHGAYFRKPDRPTLSGKHLNPIRILRFICKFCKRTCSTLPECIPPRRWFLWDIQQSVIEDCLSQKSINSIHNQSGVSRHTINRWSTWLIEDRFKPFAYRLKTLVPWLGTNAAPTAFWAACFNIVSLSKAMLTVNNLGDIIP